MSEKTKALIAGICILLVIAAILVCVLPWSRKVPASLHVVQLDAQHNEVQTFTVSMDGKLKNFLFGRDRLSVEISAFGRYQWFKPVQNGTSNVYGEVTYSEENKYYTSYYCAWDNERQQTVVIILLFSKDFSKWLFFDTNNGIFYTASGDDSVTSQQILEYFDAYISIYGSNEP